MDVAAAVTVAADSTGKVTVVEELPTLPVDAAVVADSPFEPLPLPHLPDLSVMPSFPEMVPSWHTRVHDLVNGMLSLKWRCLSKSDVISHVLMALADELDVQTLNEIILHLHFSPALAHLSDEPMQG